MGSVQAPGGIAAADCSVPDGSAHYPELSAIKTPVKAFCPALPEANE
jgi:hypothetical protein